MLALPDLSDQRASPQGWFRHDLCLHRVSVGGQRRMEDNSRCRHADHMAARNRREGTQDLIRAVAGDQGRDRLCRIWPGRARRACPMRRSQNKAGQFRQAGSGRRAGCGERHRLGKDRAFLAIADRSAGRRRLSDHRRDLRGRAGRGRVGGPVSAACTISSASLSKRARQDATALGYVPVPPALVEQIEQYWAKEPTSGN